MIQAGFLCNTGSSKSFQLSHARGAHKKKKNSKEKKRGRWLLGFWLSRGKFFRSNRWLGGFFKHAARGSGWIRWETLNEIRDTHTHAHCLSDREVQPTTSRPRGIGQVDWMTSQRRQEKIETQECFTNGRGSKKREENKTKQKNY
jgi:hypothetical protein